MKYMRYLFSFGIVVIILIGFNFIYQNDYIFYAPTTTKTSYKNITHLLRIKQKLHEDTTVGSDRSNINEVILKEKAKSKFQFNNAQILTTPNLNAHNELKTTRMVQRQNVKSLFSSKVELTIRMTGKEELITALFCDFLRSAVLFWNPMYTALHLILDEEDRSIMLFQDELPKMALPFTIRYTFESQPKNDFAFVQVGLPIGQSYGYVRQLYSSFLFDLYTNASVIAWCDTDIMFTQPVLNESIIRNGKLVALGMNHFKKYDHVRKQWDKTNIAFLGLPMVSDFMTYFPVFVYRSTIRNCREYILKYHNSTSFEDVFIEFTTMMVSPVSIIMSYAYYFEKHLYEWHIDIGEDTLESYNKERLPNHPLSQEDILPELHLTVHSDYYKPEVHPLTDALCFMQINVERNVSEICHSYIKKTNFMLFDFSLDPLQNHQSTWCKRGKRRMNCKKLIAKQYRKLQDLYVKKLIKVDTSLIKLVEEGAKSYEVTCQEFQYDDV